MFFPFELHVSKHIGTQKVPQKHKEKLLHVEGGRTLDHAAQGSCGISVSKAFKTYLDACLHSR